MPIENASTVHTTIMENTQRIDEIVVAFDTADFDLLITCPATSDGCRILEIYWDDDDLDVADNVDLGAVTATINGEDAAIVADLNTQINDGTVAVAGVSGITIGGGDTLRIVVEDTSASASYDVVIFIQTEGNTAATAAFVV